MALTVTWGSGGPVVVSYSCVLIDVFPPSASFLSPRNKRIHFLHCTVSRIDTATFIEVAYLKQSANMFGWAALPSQRQHSLLHTCAFAYTDLAG